MGGLQSLSLSYATPMVYIAQVLNGKLKTPYPTVIPQTCCPTVEVYSDFFVNETTRSRYRSGKTPLRKKKMSNESFTPGGFYPRVHVQKSKIKQRRSVFGRPRLNTFHHSARVFGGPADSEFRIVEIFSDNCCRCLAVLYLLVFFPNTNSACNTMGSQHWTSLTNPKRSQC